MPRTWQQLQLDALQTGLYDQYVGDGATVPWLELAPVLGVTPYLYKLYLDQRWPEAFKLHDFLYTPYGAMIGATQEEADLALRDMIALDSPFDASIVYAAVSTFGHNWFGTSMTGVGVRNRELTPPEEFRGMAIKAVMLFKNSVGTPGGGQERIAGFSESVWYPSDNVDALLTILGISGPVANTLLTARAGLLPTSASIVGVKLYQGGAGKGRSFGVSRPGSSGLLTDVPNIALLMSAVSGVTGAVRRWWIHSIPDSMVDRGEFKPNFAYTTALGQYLTLLQNFGFLTLPAAPVKQDITTIVTVAPVAPATIPNGLVTVTNTAGFTAGADVRVSQIFNPVTNLTYSLNFKILDVPNATQILIANYDVGNTQGGNIQMTSKVFSPFVYANMNAVRVGTRKVGNPPDRFRGRRSRRRVTA